MGEAAMELSSEQKDFIGNYVSDFVRGNLKVWIAENAAVQMHNEQEMQIRERIIRVEESLDKHIELTKLGFEAMDKRFAEVDKRFELLTGQMDKRFGEMDKRFELLTGQVDKRFNQMFAYFTTGIVILGVLITAFGLMG